MSNGDISRRIFLRNTAYAGGGLVLFGGCTSGGGTDGGSTIAPNGIEGAEVITDPARFPAAFKESPDFAKLVADGRLPKVADRIGQDPLVLKPVQGIGKYGGEIRRAFTSAAEQSAITRFCAGPDSLLYWDYQHEKVVPNIARDFEMSADSRELVLHLRRGMKWSDGHPFTADDILFWRNDISLNPAIGRGSSALRPRGKDVLVEKVDDVTVRFRCQAPFAVLPEFIAGWTDISGLADKGNTGGGGFAPAHYLSRFHPKYTSEAAATAQARQAGFASWQVYLLNRSTWWFNTELPMVTPWLVTRPSNDPPWELAANPYSIWVDTDGNQLPYIPKISLSTARDPEVITLRMVSGEFDFQDRGLQVAKLPVLVQNQQRGNYTVHRAPGDSMDCVIRINLAYDRDPEIGNLLRTVEFRRALSLGIEREQINQTFFLGSSVPSPTLPAESSPYHPGPEYKTRWATHDVAQANQLLDGIGLTKKDAEGFRMRPSGGDRLRLRFQSTSAFADFPAIGEMIRQQWRQIGIEVLPETLDSALILERSVANEMMMTVNTVLTDDPFTLPDTFLPTNTTSFAGMNGIPYAKWFSSGGRDGVEPPASMSLLKDAMDLYWRGLEVDKAARVPLGKQLFAMHADQVWSIGIVGFGLAVNGIYCVNNNLGNVPGRIFNNTPQRSATNTYPMTFYYK